MTESPFAPRRRYLLGDRINCAISTGVTQPSSLLRAHAPDLSPLHAFVLRSSVQSSQVAVSPCWAKAFPDAISANLCSHAWTPTPVLLLVHLLVSSQETSAFPALEPGRLRTSLRSATSERPIISGLQSFTHVQACRAARHPDRSHRGVVTGQPWLLRPSIVAGRCLPALRICLPSESSN